MLTASVFGLIAWYQHPHPGCGFSCYLTSPDSPFSYIVKNALLTNPYWTQHTIAETPDAILRNWNSPVWTLFFESLCYLLVLVLVLGLAGFLTRRALALAVTLLLWASITVITLTPSLSAHFTLFHLTNLEAFLRFAENFLTSSVLYLYRDRVPDRGWLALACAADYVVGVVLPTGGRVPTSSFTPSDIVVPLVVYPVLWLGIHLPLRRFGARNDYSYGIYIYGWPVTQMLVLWNLPSVGVALFVPLRLLASVPFAVGSWWLVERHALRLKVFAFGSRRGVLVGPSRSPAGPEGRSMERAADAGWS